MAEARDPELGGEALHRFTVEQYRRLAQAGILEPDERVELLEGLLVEKMTKNPPHRIATRCTREALAAVVPEGWYVDAQEPITTADSEPEPDVAVIRGRTQDYATENPPSSKVGLVVEVADVTLARDRVLKGRIYASASIPTYWIVDLTARRLEVYTDPTRGAEPAAYGQRAVYAPGDEVPVVLDGSEVGRVPVASLFA